MSVVGMWNGCPMSRFGLVPPEALSTKTCVACGTDEFARRQVVGYRKHLRAPAAFTT